MTTMIKTATTATALLAALALPIASQAASTTSAGPQHYVFETRETQSFHAGEYDGTLRLTIYPNGIASGSFQNADSGAPRTVSGGVSGTQIWLDIGGAMHSVHLTGTFKDGVIDATENLPGPDVTTFHATIEPDSR